MKYLIEVALLLMAVIGCGVKSDPIPPKPTEMLTTPKPTPRPTPNPHDLQRFQPENEDE